MVNVYSYARTSVDDGRKVSVDAQLTKIETYASKQEDSIPFVYVDKGFSGGTENRPDFQRLKETIVQNNSVGILYVWRYDRIARNTKNLLEFLEFCEHHHVQVHSVTEPLPNGVGTSIATQKMFVQVLGILGEMQRNVTIENINATLAYKKTKKQYLGSSVPIGYLLENGNVSKNPETAPMIKRIFELYATEKYGYKSLVKQLSKEGYLYKGKPLAIHRIPVILGNSLYYGWIKGGNLGGYYGNFQPIISESLFHKVQEIREQRHCKKKNGRVYPLRQKISCPYCGWFLSPKRISHKQTGKEHHYYHCANRQCEGVTVSASKIESQVMKHIQEFLSKKELLDGLTTAVQEELMSIQRNNQQYKKKIDQQRTNLFEAFEKDQLSTNEFKKQLEQLNKNNARDPHPKLSEAVCQQKLTALLQLTQQPIKDVLWVQLKEIRLTKKKNITEIYLKNINQNILQWEGRNQNGKTN